MSCMFYKLILPLLICANCFGQADRFLILEHRTKTKEVVVQEGAFVMVKTFKGERISGRMRVLSESLIKVKHKVVPLTNVERIGVRNQAMSQFGAAAFSMGVNLLFYRIQNGLKNGWREKDGSLTASVPFLAAGGGMLWWSPKRRAKHWTFKGQMEGW